MMTLSAKVEDRELKRYLARLDKNHGKPLATRTERTIRAASQRVLVPRIKAAAPRGRGHYEAGGRTRSGTLRRKVRSKLLRKRAGEYIRPTKTHSAAFYAHMVIGGTTGHNLGKRGRPYVAFATDEVRRAADVWHPGAKANPFIDRAVSGGAMARVTDHVKRDVFDVK